MNLTGEQKRTILAAWLGWTLDAFDFFLLTFLLKDIAKEFGVEVSAVAYALFLTLAMRFVGAFIFRPHRRQMGTQARPDARHPLLFDHRGARGLLAEPDDLPRAARPLRHRDGRRMGSSLAMESIPPQARGTVSGILQCGYPSGFLIAAVAYGLLYGRTFGDYTIGWRAMFLLSVLPAFVVLFIRSSVPESPAFEASQVHEQPHLWATVAEHKGLVLYMVLLMLCFNLFSHGTQDLYPTFLQKQHNFDPAIVSWITIVANLGAIAGGLAFGHWSEKIGRVNAITIASLIALPALPLWAYALTPALLALGAFVMQVAVQGAWGVVPAHLNELTPGAARATIPAFVYQADNFLASYNGPFQARIAEANGGDYSYALALVAGVVAVAMIVVIRFSPERRGHVLVAH